MVNFNVEKDILISGGDDGTLIFWKLSTYEQISVVKSLKPVYDLLLSNDASHFYLASVHGYLALWSVEKNAIVQPLRGHTGTVICLLKRGNMLASASNKILIYNLDRNHEVILEISLNGGYAWR
jgi:WD40 repeat protein